LLTGEPFARQLQEQFAVALQGIARELAEDALQLLACPRQSLLAFRAHGFLGFEPRPQQLGFDARGALAPRSPDERRERPECNADRQRQPDRAVTHTAASFGSREMREVIDAGVGREPE